MVKDARAGLRHVSNPLAAVVGKYVPNLPKGVEVFLQRELTNELLFSTLNSFMKAYREKKIDFDQQGLIVAGLTGKIEDNRDLTSAFTVWMSKNSNPNPKDDPQCYGPLWDDSVALEKCINEPKQKMLFSL